MLWPREHRPAFNRNHLRHSTVLTTCGGIQPGKSLYTTVRELVENSLDSCEGIGEPPNVTITMYGLVWPGLKTFFSSAPCQLLHRLGSLVLVLQIGGVNLAAE